MTKKPNYVFDDELYHHGILGQRWGHRRFQNEDGSWTPEGRERYGEGDARSKAKATYETQKYKANLKSKAQKEKDVRAAKEERNRIKEQAKTNKLIKKEQAKLDQQGAKKFGNTKKMSDEDLAKAIDRLKLQSEYNKQYALAKKPDGALAKADRFFEGPTGKAVTQIAVETLPNVANTVVSKVLDSKLKYANKEDRDKQAADIEKVRAEAEKARTEGKAKLLTAESSKIKSENAMADSELQRRIAISNQKASLWERKNAVDRLNKESENTIKIARSEQAIKAAKARLDMKVENIKQFGGLEYTDSKGAKYKTSGLIVEDDLQKQLETIKKRKDMGFW